MEDYSVARFREVHGPPALEPIIRFDEKPLTEHVPSHAVSPFAFIGKAREFTLAHVQDMMLIDFGEAYSPATEKRLGRDCHISENKRAPEAFFEPDEVVSYPSDIWSLGCAIWQILSMKFIIADSDEVDELIAEQIDVLGSDTFPERWLKKWKRPDKEEETGEYGRIPREPSGPRKPWPPPLDKNFEYSTQKYRRKSERAGTLDEEETQAFLDLMRGMFRFLPEERMTIEEVLQSKWMVKWALPQLRESQAIRPEAV